ncbi:DUF761 domain protein [Senna tora]|uniref:DUF761 domain protein n=1 Tax=Senna tora TaxID=362788 RepID=A0A835CG10_9FABA|nr:DUF761 domain protein [Senna tora]
MSRQKLTKKLQPAKKAWRNFSNTLQSKVHKLNIPKAIRTTIQRLVSTYHSLHLFVSTKLRHHRSLPTRPYYNNSSSSYHHVHHRKNFRAIRIDDLFSEPPPPLAAVASSSSSWEARSKGKAVMMGMNKDLGEGGESSNGLDTIEDAWKVVVAKSPQLQVDQKAEEFISKFREDMKLQKEKSMLEFQERLARSS